MFLQSVLGDDRHGEGEESGPPSELDLFVSMNYPRTNLPGYGQIEGTWRSCSQSAPSVCRRVPLDQVSFVRSKPGKLYKVRLGYKFGRA